MLNETTKCREYFGKHDINNFLYHLIMPLFVFNQFHVTRQPKYTRPIAYNNTPERMEAYTLLQTITSEKFYFLFFPCYSLKVFVVLFPYAYTRYFYSACWTAFIGANSSKIVAHWTAHTESSSACASTVYYCQGNVKCVVCPNKEVWYI